jgi:predicted RNase H-like HicB family nuclease
VKAYAVIYERGKRNWSGYVPDLPGCIATGKTRSEVERRMRGTIRFHLESLREQGEPIPEPTTEAGTVSVPA